MIKLPLIKLPLIKLRGFHLRVSVLSVVQNGKFRVEKPKIIYNSTRETRVLFVFRTKSIIVPLYKSEAGINTRSISVWEHIKDLQVEIERGCIPAWAIWIHMVLVGVYISWYQFIYFKQNIDMMPIHVGAVTVLVNEFLTVYILQDS